VVRSTAASLEHIGRVVENGAERVFQQFEKEGEHRRECERISLKAQTWDFFLGKIFALVFVLAVLAVAAYAIYSRYPYLGGIISAFTIGAVVWAFTRERFRGRKGG